MGKPISKVVDISGSFWRTLANSVIKKVKSGGKKGKGAEGSFKKYSASYKKRKAGGKFNRQSSTSVKPDLTLTGDMWQDFQVIDVDKKGAIIGWASEGDKVEWAEKTGRAITTDKNPVAPKIQKYILKNIDKELEKNIKKVADTTTIKIGI